MGECQKSCVRGNQEHSFKPAAGKGGKGGVVMSSRVCSTLWLIRQNRRGIQKGRSLVVCSGRSNLGSEGEGGSEGGAEGGFKYPRGCRRRWCWWSWTGLCDQTMELKIDLSGAAIARIHVFRLHRCSWDRGVQTCPVAGGPMEHWVTTDREQETPRIRINAKGTQRMVKTIHELDQDAYSERESMSRRPLFPFTT